MVGANAENAHRAIEKVRESWAKLPHFSNGREFHSTFSAGRGFGAAARNGGHAQRGGGRGALPRQGRRARPRRFGR